MMTETAKKAIRVLVRLGQGRPVRAATFGRAMWPDPKENIPKSNPNRNRLAGGYLAKLVRLGLVERVYGVSRGDAPGYVPTQEGLEELEGLE